MQNLTKTLKQFSKSFVEHELLTRAAATAFYFTISLAPLILLLLASSSLVSWESRQGFLDFIEKHANPRSYELIENIAKNTLASKDSAKAFNLVSLLFLLITSSTLFIQLQDSMDLISGKRNLKKSLIKQWLSNRVLGIFIVIGFLLTSLLSILISSSLRIFTNFFDNLPIRFLASFIDFIFFYIIFIFIYLGVPRRRLPWKITLLIALMANSLFHLSKYLLGAYIANSNLSSTYGLTGSIVLIMLWAYVTSIVLLACYEFVITLIKSDDHLA